MIWPRCDSCRRSRDVPMRAVAVAVDRVVRDSLTLCPECYAGVVMTLAATFTRARTAGADLMRDRSR